MEARDFSSKDMATSMACRVRSTSTHASSHTFLVNSQSVGHYLHKAFGNLAVIEQLGHVFSPRFAHALPQCTVLHERQKVLGDVGHAGSVFSCARIFEHDSMRLEERRVGKACR